jgi:hypothetical protein
MNIQHHSTSDSENKHDLIGCIFALRHTLDTPLKERIIVSVVD